MGERRRAEEGRHLYCQFVFGDFFWSGTTNTQTILENSFIKHVLQLAVNEMYALNC